MPTDDEVDAPQEGEPIAEPITGELNARFSNLIDTYQRGISNTSTVKYDAIRELFAEEFDLELESVYATGAATRPSNLDTRLAQGNQRSSHTTLGLAFLKIQALEHGLQHDLDRATASLANTCRKFVQGLEGTTYDILVLLIQHGDEPEVHPTQVMFSGREDLARDIADRLSAPFIREELANAAEQQQAGEEVGQVEELYVEVDWTKVSADATDPCGLISLEKPLIEAAAAIKAGKNVILFGPPGTGKTELAICLARTLGVEYELVTATSDWTTFDTIGGYLPSHDEEKNVTSLDFVSTAVASSFERGSWLVVDELNRADIDKAFGELFSLLSDKPVRLPYKKMVDGEALDVVLLPDGYSPPRSAYVIAMPANWAMLGTMNTFDKASLYSLSYAFMRRFAFIDVSPPPADKYRQLLDEKWGPVHDAFDGQKEAFLDLFAGGVAKGLDKIGLPVGPAIPLDVIRHIQARSEIIQPEEADTAGIVLGALEMYLFPQFEGKDREHEEILTVLEDLFALDAAGLTRLSSNLSRWTGFEPR